jgi:hypothetical protein
VSDPDFADLAAAALRRRPVESRVREVSRDHGIGVVAEAMAERRRRKTVRGLLLGGGLVAAAGVALFIGLGGFERVGQGSGGHVRVEGQAGRVSEHKLEHGQSVVSGQGRSTVVEFGSGTRITLTDQGELVYREDTAVQRFGLVRGAAHLVVARLTDNQRFIVDTADAEVEVRGTVFDVAIAEGEKRCPERTLVSVTEGAVQVRSAGTTRMLRSGEKWESACVPRVPTPAAPEPGAQASKASSALVAGARASTEESESPEGEAAPGALDDAKTEVAGEGLADSKLTEQNDLFAAATAARQAGSRARALELYDRLLARFPRGPLAESAGVERIRVLWQLDPERARAAARSHLARYRDGIATKELETLAEGP